MPTKPRKVNAKAPSPKAASPARAGEGAKPAKGPRRRHEAAGEARAAVAASSAPAAPDAAGANVGEQAPQAVLVAAQRAARRRTEVVAHAVEQVKIGNKRGTPPMAALALPAHVLLRAAHAHLVDREPAESIAARLGVTRPPEPGATPRGRKGAATRRAAQRAKAEGKLALTTFRTWLGRVRTVYDKIERDAHKARVAAYGPFAADMTLDGAAEDVGLRMAAVVAEGLKNFATLSDKDQANIARLGAAVINAPRTRAHADRLAAGTDKIRAEIASKYDDLDRDPRENIPRGEVAEILAQALLGHDARDYMANTRGAPGKRGAK